MSNSVYLPALGESVTEGIVTRWLKNVGDRIEIDEPLVEVSTDKVDTEIPSPFAGVIAKILVNEDETAQVGAALAVIADSETSFIDIPVAPDKPVESVVEPTKQPETSVPTESSIPENSVKLPALGESVTEGIVTRWLKNVGDRIEIDEPLVEVSTDKVDTEIPSPFAGVIAKILVNEDETAQVGQTLVLIGSEVSTEVPSSSSEETPSVSLTTSSTAKVENIVTSAVSKITEVSQTSYATPLVRKLAKQYNIQLNEIQGSGVGGRIRKEDILKAAQQTQPTQTETATIQVETTPVVLAQPPVTPKIAKAAAPTTNTDKNLNVLRGTTQKLTRRRQVIAKNLVQSLQVAAQLTTVIEVDVTQIAHLRNKAKTAFAEREGVKLSFLPFFAKAAIEALKAHPTINASLNTQSTEATYFDVENLGIAVDTDSGLVVPVIKNAGNLNISGIAKAISDLASRTRNNKISPDDLSGATFTLTNTGSRGALFDTPIVNQPQVAILGTGSVVKKPVVITGNDGSESIAIRQTVYLALSYDHRLVDGADAARFLGTVKTRLEEGNFENDLGL